MKEIYQRKGIFSKLIECLKKGARFEPAISWDTSLMNHTRSRQVSSFVGGSTGGVVAVLGGGELSKTKRECKGNDVWCGGEVEGIG